jgi:hypothetical protein
MANIKTLPCPFCGSSDKSKYPPEVIVMQLPSISVQSLYLVRCSNCGATSGGNSEPLGVSEKIAKLNAIKNWNERN